MPSADLWPLAQQGNPQALETIFKMHNPEPSWVVKVRLHNNCLQVLLEAEPTPDQQRAVALVQSFLAQLQPLTITAAQTVRIWGRRRGQLLADWVEDLALTPYLQPPAVTEQTLEAEPVTADLADTQGPECPATEPDAIAADVTDSPDFASQEPERETITPEFATGLEFASQEAEPAVSTSDFAAEVEAAADVPELAIPAVEPDAIASEFADEQTFADEQAITNEFVDEFTDAPERERLELEPHGGSETLLDTFFHTDQELDAAEPASSVEDLSVEDLSVEDLEDIQEPEISPLALTRLTLADEELADGAEQVFGVEEHRVDGGLTDADLTDEDLTGEIAGDQAPDDLTTALLADEAEADDEGLATEEPVMEGRLTDPGVAAAQGVASVSGAAPLLTGLMAKSALDAVVAASTTDREGEAQALAPEAPTEEVATVQASEALAGPALAPETVASETFTEALTDPILVETGDIDAGNRQATEFSSLAVDRIEAMELEGQALEPHSALDTPAEDWQAERQDITPTATPEPLLGPPLAIAQPQAQAEAETEEEEAEWFLRPEIVVVVLFALFVIIWQTYEAILEEVGDSDASLSSSGLARRLNTTRRTINRMKKQPDFSQWTQSRDPDAIAWVYGENGRFTPVLTPVLTSTVSSTDTPT